MDNLLNKLIARELWDKRRLLWFHNNLLLVTLCSGLLTASFTILHLTTFLLLVRRGLMHDLLSQCIDLCRVLSR